MQELQQQQPSLQPGAQCGFLTALAIHQSPVQRTEGQALALGAMHLKGSPSPSGTKIRRGSRSQAEAQATQTKGCSTKKCARSLGR